MGFLPIGPTQDTLRAKSIMVALHTDHSTDSYRLSLTGFFLVSFFSQNSCSKPYHRYLYQKNTNPPYLIFLLIGLTQDTLGTTFLPIALNIDHSTDSYRLSLTSFSLSLTRLTSFIKELILPPKYPQKMEKLFLLFF